MHMREYMGMTIWYRTTLGKNDKNTSLNPLLFPDIPYILESNPHSVFGDFLNGKKLIWDSNPHLSFNRPLPTGQLIE